MPRIYLAALPVIIVLLTASNILAASARTHHNPKHPVHMESVRLGIGKTLDFLFYPRTFSVKSPKNVEK